MDSVIRTLYREGKISTIIMDTYQEVLFNE
jgi:hypothetical protein